MNYDCLLMLIRNYLSGGSLSMENDEQPNKKE